MPVQFKKITIIMCLFIGLITPGLVVDWVSAKSSDTSANELPVAVLANDGTNNNKTTNEKKPVVVTQTQKKEVTKKTVPPQPVAAPSIQVTVNPTAGRSLYVPPQLPNRNYGKIAGQPLAQWVGDWTPNLTGAVADIVRRATAVAQVPVIVAYNIPIRDCSGYSSGGAGSAAAYTQWINELAAGIGGNTAIVILEPDALPYSDCLQPSQLATRLQLLSDAVTVLKSRTGAAVYIDAGHPRWKSAEAIAASLLRANILNADGFSLNVSNFYSNEENIAYGTRVSSLVQNKHFVIDTSRNGNGPSSNEWCNPRGRALGTIPTTATGRTLVDAYLWIKTPGESDGSCNGGPLAGQWWQEYADELSRNTAW